MTTAMIVAANVEFLPTIAAMVLRVAPAIVFPLLIYVAYRSRGIITEIGDEDEPVFLIAATLLLIAAVYFSWTYTLLLCMAVFALHGLYVFGQRKKWKLRLAWARFSADRAAKLTSTITLIAVAFGPSWLAWETSVIGNEEKVLSAIKETDEYIYYLDRKTNRVVYAKPSDLTQRTFCNLGEADTVASFIKSTTEGRVYPQCPEIEGTESP